MNVRDAVDAAETALAAAGCDTPKLDAELLIADALGVDRSRLVTDPELPIQGAQARLIGERVRRRAQREPVAYILGRKGFRNIELAVDSRVLIPRPDTELLVEVAVGLPPSALPGELPPNAHLTDAPTDLPHGRRIHEAGGGPASSAAGLSHGARIHQGVGGPAAAAGLPRGARVHDVGTGSGAVALAVLDERPDLLVTASDLSLAAVEVARGNAARLGLPLDVIQADGLPPGDYDLVLANLPYVRDDEWDGLAPEITRYEPREALTSGPDGLDAIRALIASAPPGTRLALEHAPAQAGSIQALLLEPVTHRDLAGRDRVTCGRTPL